MKKYQKGYRAERKLVNLLKDKAILAVRTAGSHSPIDVIAVFPSRVLFFQVKSGKSRISKKEKELLWELETDNSSAYVAVYDEGKFKIYDLEGNRLEIFENLLFRKLR